MTNKIVTNLRSSRNLCLAGWNTPTEFYWAYDDDRLLGKIWRVFHKTEKIHSIDPKDTIPAAPTAEELIIFLKSIGRCPIIINATLEKEERLVDVLADFIIKNELLDKAGN